MSGYDTAAEHCAHGFRSTFPTLCNQEMDRDDNKLWDSDVSSWEESVKAIYNRIGPLALIGPRTDVGNFSRVYPDIDLDSDFTDPFADVIDGRDLVLRSREVSDSWLNSCSLGIYQFKIVG